MKKDKSREELREEIQAKDDRKRVKKAKRRIVKEGPYEMTDEQKKSTAKVAKRRLEASIRKKEKELRTLHPKSKKWKQKKREIENLKG